jgi:hypothetical protein
MFFDRENEPDLGDERFGHERDSYCSDASYEPSYNTSSRSYIIPLWMFNASKEILISHFEKRVAEQRKKEQDERRNREIAELEEKLAKLKGST